MSFSLKLTLVTALALLNGFLLAMVSVGAVSWFAGLLLGVGLPFVVAMVMIFKEQP